MGDSSGFDFRWIVFDDFRRRWWRGRRDWAGEGLFAPVSDEVEGRRWECSRDAVGVFVCLEVAVGSDGVSGVQPAVHGCVSGCLLGDSFASCSDVEYECSGDVDVFVSVWDEEFVCGFAWRRVCDDGTDCVWSGACQCVTEGAQGDFGAVWGLVDLCVACGETWSGEGESSPEDGDWSRVFWVLDEDCCGLEDCLFFGQFCGAEGEWRFSLEDASNCEAVVGGVWKACVCLGGICVTWDADDDGSGVWGCECLCEQQKCCEEDMHGGSDE